MYPHSYCHCTQDITTSCFKCKACILVEWGLYYVAGVEVGNGFSVLTGHGWFIDWCRVVGGVSVRTDSYSVPDGGVICNGYISWINSWWTLINDLVPESTEISCFFIVYVAPRLHIHWSCRCCIQKMSHPDFLSQPLPPSCCCSDHSALRRNWCREISCHSLHYTHWKSLHSMHPPVYFLFRDLPE